MYITSLTLAAQLCFFKYKKKEEKKLYYKFPQKKPTYLYY